MDAVADHAGREQIAYLVKSKLVSRSGRKPNKRPADKHTRRMLVIHEVDPSVAA